MASRYSAQFDIMVREMCREFGTKLIKSWDADAPKDEIAEFVDEAVRNFFGGGEEPESEPIKFKSSGKGGKGLKRCDALVAESEPEPEPESPPPPAKKAKAKGKAPAKPKCQATTAKGTKCTKCAIDDGPFCSVHIKKTAATTVTDETGETSSKKTKKKVSASKKPKTTCDTPNTAVNKAFEVPEYEREEELDEEPVPDTMVVVEHHLPILDEEEEEIENDYAREEEFDDDD